MTISFHLIFVTLGIHDIATNTDVGNACLLLLHQFIEVSSDLYPADVPPAGEFGSWIAVALDNWFKLFQCRHVLGQIRCHGTSVGSRLCPLMRSEAFSAIMIVGTFVLPEGSFGITEESTTRNPSRP